MCNKNILVLKSLTLPIYLILFVLTFSSCVTRKKKADLSILGKIYENTTARYNGYFNANEILEINKSKILEHSLFKFIIKFTSLLLKKDS